MHFFSELFILIIIVLPKPGLSPQTQEPRLQFNQWLNRCGSFPLLSAPHTLFSMWTDLKRSEKIPRAPTWRWEEWIWLTGPSGHHGNSLQGLNITYIKVFDQVRDPEIAITIHLPIYIRWLKFLQITYERVDCDLAQGFLFMISINRYDLFLKMI